MLSLRSFSQQQADLIAWQKANPTALFMTQERFSQLDEEVQQSIISSVIILEDLNFVVSREFEEEGSTSNTLGQVEIDLSESNFIKEWLATHQGVKIVKRSEYEAEETDLREVYDAPHIMVLIGEELTIEDILNF